MAVVGRVTDEESTGGFSAQQVVGLPTSDGPEVKAAFLELTMSTHHLLVVFMRAEGLVVKQG